MADEEIQTPQPDLAALMQSITALGEEIKGINSKLEAVSTEVEEPAVPVAPVTPENDPDNAPINDYKSLRQEMRETARREAQAELAEREAKVQEEKETYDQAVARIDEDLDRKAAEAVKLGYLPEIKNPQDPNDLGKVARRELFGYALKLDTTNIVSVAEELAEKWAEGKHYDITTMKFTKPDRMLEQRMAPVGSSATRTTGVQSKIDYKTLHNMPLEALAKRAMGEY